MRNSSAQITGTNTNRLAVAAFILIVLLGGSNSVAVRFSNAELPPFWGATLRFAAASLIFWLMALVQRVPWPRGRTLTGILIYGVLNFGLSYALVYYGLASIPAGLGQVLFALVPLMTLFLAIAHGLESFRWRGLVGTGIAVTGIAFAFVNQPLQNIPILPALAIVAAAACFAEATIVVKWFPASHPLIANAIAMSTGTVVLLGLSFVTGEPRILPVMPSTWIAILYLVLGGSVTVFYLFLFVIRHWTASATSYQFVLFPFVTVLVAAWLAEEQVTTALLVGGVLVLLGVWLGAIAAAAPHRE